MLNVFRAQLYRLVRTLPFWGFLVLFAFLCWVSLSALGASAEVQEEAWGPFELPFEGAVLALRPQDYLGAAGLTPFIPLLACLIAVSAFSEDFKGFQGGGTARNLVAGPHFRMAYVASGVLVMLLVTACLIVVGVAVVFAAVGPLFPRHGIEGDWASVASWAIGVLLVSVIYGTLTMAVAAAFGRLGLTVVATFLLASGQVEILLVALADMAEAIFAPWGAVAPWHSVSITLGTDLFVRHTTLRPFWDWALLFPAGQIGGPLSSASFSVEPLQLLLLVPWLCGGVVLGWLALRRRQL